MSKTFLIGDTHFGHGNILTFKRSNGSPLREFDNIYEHDETLIQNWNKVVSTEDKVYHLGDLGFKSFTQLELILKRLNGTKILIKGNHDNHELSQYAQYFKDIRGSWTLDKFVLSHIPIHPDSLYRWKACIHGHLHANSLDDPQYYNVSAECINYTPIDFEVIRKHYNDSNT